MSTNLVPLGDVCNLITDGKHGDCRNEEDSGYYFISAKDVKDGTINYLDSRQITRADFEETHRRTDLKPGDVLITNSGTIGRLAIAQDDERTPRTTFQKSVAVVKPKREILDPHYLYYVLEHSRDRLVNAAAGAAQKNLLLGEIRRFGIAMPSKDKQRSVVNLLKPYDDSIENNRRRIELLEQSAGLLFKEWFVHLRYPGHEHDKVVDAVPEGWEAVVFSDVISVNPKEVITNGVELWHVPMSSLSEVGMAVDRSEFERRTKHTNVKFRNGDTLFARITPCLENGKTGFVDVLEDGEIACGSTEFIVLRGVRVSPAFTYCLARTEPLRQLAIKSMTGSSGRQRVQEECFDKFRLALPPSALLNEFDDITSICFSQSQNLRRQNEILMKARDLFLSRLMDGRLSV